MLKNKIITLAILSSCVTGCAFPDIEATKLQIKQDKERVNKISSQMQDNRVQDDLISFSDTPFLAVKSFKPIQQLEPLPTLFDKSFSFKTNQKKDLRSYILNLHEIDGLSVKVTEDAIDKLIGAATSSNTNFKSNTNPDTKSGEKKPLNMAQKNSSAQRYTNFSINYSGTLKGYLDYLTNHSLLSWRYDFDLKKVIIFYTETKSFKLAVPEVDITNSTTISNKDQNNTSNVEYKTQESNAFKDAVETIKSMSDSENIRVSTNKAYSLVTVTTVPQIMSRVEEYVKKFNSEAQKAVQVQISIYEVKTSKDSNYGIDWKLVIKGTDSLIDWDTSGLVNALSSNITTATIKAGISGGTWGGSNIVASALQKYLDATYVQGFSFYSMNGQSTPINNGKTDAYVKNLAVTTLGAGAVITADNVQTSVEQATINTGFTGNVTTNVKDDGIFLRMSLNMSKLTRMEKLDYGSTDNPSVIQLPHTENIKTIQNVVLKSGQTAVITGFTKNDNKLGTSSLGNKDTWLLGGNQGTQAEKEELVIIVSAYNIGENK